MALTGMWGGASVLMDCLECNAWCGKVQAGVSAQWESWRRIKDQDQNQDQNQETVWNWLKKRNYWTFQHATEKCLGRGEITFFMLSACGLQFLHPSACVTVVCIYWYGATFPVFRKVILQKQYDTVSFINRILWFYLHWSCSSHNLPELYRHHTNTT